MLITTGVAVIVVLTLMTGYFVAQEFAYVTVDRGKLKQLADRGDAAAERALRITSRLSFTLSGAQFGITVTALLVGYLGEEFLVRGLTEEYADAGWLTHHEVGMLASVPARRSARAWARANGGAAGAASMRAFQDAASDLALLRSRVVNGTAEPEAPLHERELLTAITAHRAGFVGTPVV